MGSSNYDFGQRALRSQSYTKATTDQLFEQNKKREIHGMMKPQGITVRESRDSENHPNSVPIIMGLDETGSLGVIPEHIVKEGLPKLMAGIISAGVPDPQVLFLGVGDHKTDYAPLQVGQFESGDAEMDMWLQRVWLEGNGGGNGGESYHLPWYFAANHTATDAWDKRRKKGFLFTVGDEPVHQRLEGSTIQHLMGLAERPRDYTAKELLYAARERYHVYHINISHGQPASVQNGWKALLGENALEVTDYRQIPELIASIVASVESNTVIYDANPEVPQYGNTEQGQEQLQQLSRENGEILDAGNGDNRILL